MTQKRFPLRTMTALALALTLTPAPNAVYAAVTGNTTLVTQRVQALNAMHQDLAAQQYTTVMDWPALSIYAAGDSVTSAKWSTASGQNGVTARLQQLAKQQDLTDTTTDFESELLALVAAKQNPRNFARKDYVEAVQDSQLPDGKFADTIYGFGEEFLNAHIYGILALYGAGVAIPNQTLALQYLLNHQHADGGFNWDNGSTDSDPDVTAAALMAMKVLNLDVTDAHVQNALNYLKSVQTTNGDFGSSTAGVNADTCTIVIDALLMYGIDPTTFSKSSGDGNPVSALLSYELPDGHFAHARGDKTPNSLSTQNAALALDDLVAGEAVYQRLHDDNVSKSSTWTSAFSDLPTTSSDYATDIRMVNLGVMAGNADFTYGTNDSLTREQLATILVTGLGYRDQVTTAPKITRFRDVSSTVWSNSFIEVAYSNKLLVGTSDTTYSPQGTVTGGQLMTVLVHGLGLGANVHTTPWYDGFVQIAKDQGLLYPNFDPTKPATRTQLAIAFNHFYAAQYQMSLSNK